MFWEHFQLSTLNDVRDSARGVTVPMVFREFPSQELTFFGKAISEDWDQKSFPFPQILLSPSLVDFMFCTNFVRRKQVCVVIKFHDGEIF